MGKVRGKLPPQTYQIKITLKGSKPPIWRRFLVSSDMTLADFHNIVQLVMGWEDAHLHTFIIDGQSYGRVTDEDDPFGPLDGMADFEDEARVKLGSLIPGDGFKFAYEYDFGDGWEHLLLVEKILPFDPEQEVPLCIKGIRACPPEDIGGIWGYQNFAEAIIDTKHPKHKFYKEWIDGDFDPEAFDVDKVNTVLRDYIVVTSPKTKSSGGK